MKNSPITDDDLAEVGLQNLPKNIARLKPANSTCDGSGNKENTAEATTVGSVAAAVKESSPLKASTVSDSKASDSQFVNPASATNDKDKYAGDALYAEDGAPLRADGYQALAFPNPAVLVTFFDKNLLDGIVALHPWQIQTAEELANVKPTSLHPHKFCLCAANGSGKDAFVIAPFCVWFALTKVKSLTIITSSSGTQLTAQTENYIKSLAEKVNLYFGEQVFKIRQRYIKCLLTGSEIRMFATDEAGKAEGYHPIEPNAEMAIIVNEGKSVSEEIHGALKRCTGFNYWLEVSTPGEPFGYFYRAFTVEGMRFKARRVTAYDCPHISKDEIESDRIELGEHSALFRSMRLALFTSLGGTVIIGAQLVEQLILNPPKRIIGASWPLRIGIDLAAGGDENSFFACKGNQLVKEINWRETDTTITADDINKNLISLGVPKTHEHIYIDDGNVGHSITDMLVRMGWVNIRRVLNQSSAVQKKRFGNRGAEMWTLIKRILEERFYDISQLSEKCRSQLANRYYKQQATQGRITLESKKEAKAHGRPSPDRADAFILMLCGLTIDDFIDAEKPNDSDSVKQGNIKLKTHEELHQYFDDNRFAAFDQVRPGTNNKPRGSLSVLLNKTNKKSPLTKYGFNN